MCYFVTQQFAFTACDIGAVYFCVNVRPAFSLSVLGPTIVRVMRFIFSAVGEMNNK